MEDKPEESQGPEGTIVEVIPKDSENMSAERPQDSNENKAAFQAPKEPTDPMEAFRVAALGGEDEAKPAQELRKPESPQELVSNLRSELFNDEPEPISTPEVRGTQVIDRRDQAVLVESKQEEKRKDTFLGEDTLDNLKTTTFNFDEEPQTPLKPSKLGPVPPFVPEAKEKVETKPAEQPTEKSTGTEFVDLNTPRPLGSKPTEPTRNTDTPRPLNMSKPPFSGEKNKPEDVVKPAEPKTPSGLKSPPPISSIRQTPTETKPAEPKKEQEGTEKKWAKEVKELVKEGKASAWVHARVNFDIAEENGKTVVKEKMYEGYDTIMNRGIDQKTADKLHFYSRGVIEPDDYKLSRDSQKDDTLQVAIVKIKNVPEKSVYANKEYLDAATTNLSDKTLVRFTYKQPQADSSHRTSSKYVYVAVPDEIANKLNDMLRSGVNPDELKDSLADIFADEDSRSFFDASIIDRFSKNVNIRPTVVPFTKVDIMTPELGQDGRIKTKEEIIEKGHKIAIPPLRNIPPVPSKPGSFASPDTNSPKPPSFGADNEPGFAKPLNETEEERMKRVQDEMLSSFTPDSIGAGGDGGGSKPPDIPATPEAGGEDEPNKDINEVVKRMGYNSLDEMKNDISDPKLKSILIKLGTMPANRVTRDYLSNIWKELDSADTKGRMRDREGKSPFNEEEFNTVSTALNEWISELDQPTGRERGERGVESPDSFSALRRRHDQLATQATRTPDEDRELSELKVKMDSIKKEAQDQGLTEDIDKNIKSYQDAIQALKDKRRKREFRPQDALNFTRQLEKTLAVARERTQRESGKFRGVRESVLEDRLGLIINDARELSSTELPTSKEGQQEAVRTILARIEENDVGTLEWLNTQDTKLLNDFLANPNIKEEVRGEILARLRLQDCFVGIKRAFVQGGNDPNDPNKATGGLFKQEQRRLSANDRLLTGHDFQVLLRTTLPESGIPISEAFEMLQKAAIETDLYGQISEAQQEGKRKALAIGLEQEILAKAKLEPDPEKRMTMENNAKENAAKAIQLADRIAWATLEVSVWHKDLTSIDPIAGAIYLQNLREGRGLELDRGPEITIDLVKGVGTSFLRGAQDTSKQKILPGATRRFVVSNTIKSGDKNIDVIDYSRSSLDLSKASFENMGAGAYGTYIGSTVPRMLQGKEFFLKTRWKPDELDQDDFEKTFNEVFTTLDPDSPDPNLHRQLNLRKIFVLGALSYLSINPVNAAREYKWDSQEIIDTRKAVLRVIGNDQKTGKKISFLTPEEWKDIDDFLNLTGPARFRGPGINRGVSTSVKLDAVK